MAINWNRIFEFWGEKQVSHTDKEKSAYVVNAEQRRAIEGAGQAQSPGFELAVLFDRQISLVTASYYHSERSLEAARAPEPRMGREFISNWLEVGDSVILGSVNSNLFAFKSANAPQTEEIAVQEIALRANSAAVLARARQVGGTPEIRTVQREEYVRSPWIVSAALRRANSRCEMPGCVSAPLWREDGSVYLEVHHILPLGEGGWDAIHNAAALCPRCHRELHYGADSQIKRAILQAFILALDGSNFWVSF